jgi:hypothetical protein
MVMDLLGQDPLSGTAITGGVKWRITVELRWRSALISQLQPPALL